MHKNPANSLGISKAIINIPVYIYNNSSLVL
jgi:hypothetical protein